MTVSSLASDLPYREASETVQAGGVSWRVQRVGSGPAVLLIHGPAASTHSFRVLAGALAAHFQVIMADLPDHGFSGVLEAPTLPRVADGLRALIDRLGVSPALVVGHSAGAAIALRTALDWHVPGAQVVSVCAALKPYGGVADGLASQAAPLTLVAADRDLATPARDAEQVLRFAPAAQIIRLTGVGHFAHEESPDGVAYIIRRLARDAGLMNGVDAPANAR